LVGKLRHEWLLFNVKTVETMVKYLIMLASCEWWQNEALSILYLGKLAELILADWYRRQKLLKIHSLNADHVV
jgi:hypothetical protein